MRNFSSTLLMFVASIAVSSLTGCGDDPAPKSMTDGVELSEVEAYEQALQAMEAEDANSMDETVE